MDSSVIADRDTSGIVDKIPNALSTSCINGGDIGADGAASGCCVFVVGDETDDSFPVSINASNSKRKFESGSGNGNFDGEDEEGCAPIEKSRKLEIPMLVAPLRSVKPTQSLNSVSPGSVAAEDLALPLSACPMEGFAENGEASPPINSCRQFWKAGDYEGNSDIDPISSSVGMDHVRVHPKFLHSNATSHKWALGAFAELLDNSLDEVCNGATYVHIDALENERDGSKMLLIEDDGGGMGPEKMRRCMSLGYSSKRKMPNTIGQYGNGFKTSTMRLGADVLVFSRCKGSDQRGPTQSIGMLSYTFLRDTGKEDIVVPMVDFELKEDFWSKMMRSEDDWNRNLEIIARWSPYSNKEDLLEQFNFLKEQGTRIIIYNLWEDDEGHLELDLDADPHDIQIRGGNRDEKNIKMAQLYPNSRHYLTYRHSLRIYASILYLRLPPGFRVILRGKDVEHHSIVDDLMLTKDILYRPHQLPSGAAQKHSNMSVTVTIGFVKDARSHIDVQGFNVYHKNRLIKPFWRIWNPAGSDGRGVIGVLEANFVEPAHDKQGFEKTTVLTRLESRLIQIQKTYWTQNCHEVGYAARRRCVESSNYNMDHKLNSQPNPNGKKSPSATTVNLEKIMLPRVAVNNVSTQAGGFTPGSTMYTSTPHRLPAAPPAIARVNHLFGHPSPLLQPPASNSNGMLFSNSDPSSLMMGKEEQSNLRERLTDPYVRQLVSYLSNERDKCRTQESKVVLLEKQLCEATEMLEEKEKERMVLIEFSSAEITKKEKEIENLKERLSNAFSSNDKLRMKISELETLIHNLSNSNKEPDREVFTNQANP